MNKLLFTVVCCSVVISYFTGCCPEPVINQPPKILPLPNLIMGQNQTYIFNLAPYGSDDQDYGANLTWSFEAADQNLVVVVVDQEQQLLILFSGDNIGTATINLTLSDSSGLISDPANLEIEVRGIGAVLEGEGEAEGEGEIEPQTVGLTCLVRPSQAGEIAVDQLLDKYPIGTVLKLTLQLKEGYRFEHWEGPVDNAFVNPTTVVMLAETVITAVCTPIDPVASEGEGETDCDVDSPENFFDVAIFLLDDNGDSELAWSEIVARFSGLKPSYESIVMSADANQNGSLSKEEFAGSFVPTLLIMLKGQPDANGDNVITYQEVINIVKEITPEEFQNIDANGNGVIDCSDLNVL